MNIRNNISLVALVFLSLINLTAQDTNDSLTIELNFKNQNFFKNNEYFNDVVEGYTLIGTWVRPELRFSLANKIDFDLGGHFMKYSGKDNFKTTLPIIRFTYRPSETFQMIMGNLHGTDSHNMPAPLFDYEKKYIDPIESGLQFLFKTKRWNMDLWLDWNKFLEYAEPTQEELYVGISTEFKLINNNKNYLSIPFYSITSHKGGQVNFIEDTIQTLQNTSTGLKYKRRFGNKQLELEALAFLYEDSSPNKTTVEEYGSALYFKSSLKALNWTYGFNYWHTDAYFSHYGTPYYQTTSLTHRHHAVDSRDLLIPYVYYHKQIIKGVNLNAGFKAFYDLKSSQLDYYTELTIRCDFTAFRYKGKLPKTK